MGRKADTDVAKQAAAMIRGRRGGTPGRLNHPSAGFLPALVATLAIIAAVADIAASAEPESVRTQAFRAGAHRGAHVPAAPVTPNALVPVSTAPPGSYRAQLRLDKGMFLIAARRLHDPNFARTVVLLVDYGENGAMGVVINRPTELTLAEVLPTVQELAERRDRLYVGGPVARDRIVLLLRSSEQPEEAAHVFDDIYVSGSETALRRMAGSESFNNTTFHAYVGHAGWAPGQLEGETARGDWLLAYGDSKTVFEMDAARVWPELIRRHSGVWVRRQLRGQEIQTVHNLPYRLPQGATPRFSAPSAAGAASQNAGARAS